MVGVKICPKCGNEQGKIIDSRQDSNGLVRRRHKCLICGRRWSTLELPADFAERLLRNENA